MDLVKKDNNSSKLSNEKKSIWSDYLIQEYYSDYYDELTSKQLDSEFRNEIRTLVKSMSKLNEYERKEMIKVLSEVINFYVENKVNKELENSLSNIFKFL